MNTQEKIKHNLLEDLELARFFYCQKDFDSSKKYYVSYLEKENDNKGSIILLELFKFVRKENKEPDFLIPLYKKFDVKQDELLEFKTERNKRNQFMLNKKKFTKNESCGICMENKLLIIYDCFGHYYCEECYHNLEKCPLCKIEKHQLMNIDYSDDDSCITYIDQ